MSEITLIFASLRNSIFAILANTTWQVTLFIIFVWLLIFVSRVKTPTMRYGFWMLAVLSPVLFPLLSILAPRMNILSIVKVEDVAVYHVGRNGVSPHENSADVVSSVDTTFSFPTEMSRASPEALPAEHISPTPIESRQDLGEGFSLPFNFPDVAVAFWLIGASFMFIRLAISYRRLLRLKADAVKLDDGVVHEIIAELRQRMLKIPTKRGRMTRDLEILASERVACPISFGMASTTIILPKWILNDAKKSELEPILAHELAHIKRYDYVVNLLQRILEAIFFFHPLFYMASHNLTKEREHICDDWVIFLTQKRKDYAACLTLLLEEATFPQTIFLGMAMMNRQREIIRRIEMILSKQRKIQTTIHRKTIFAILLVGCLFIPLMAGIRIVQSLEEDTKTVEQTIENRKVEHPDEDGVEEESTGKAPQNAAHGDFTPKFQFPHEDFTPKFQFPQGDFTPKFQFPHGDFTPKFQFPQGDFTPKFQFPQGDFTPKLQFPQGDFTPMAPLNLSKQMQELMDAVRKEMLAIAVGIFRLRKSADLLTSLRYVTMGGGYGTTDRVKSRHSMYLALHYVEQPCLILKLSPQVGDEWTDIAYVEGIEGHTVVESITEKVEAPAGIFEDCLKVKTTITGVTKEYELSDAFIRGTRTMYFAPGVGLVKLEYQHETGHHTEIVLVDYAVQNDTGYFPHAVDNTWTYRWEDGYFAEKEPFTEVWTVKAQEEDVYIIHCAMRRAPEADDSR